MPRRPKPDWREEHGAVTAFGLFILLCVLMIGGLAADVTNAYRIRMQLQVAGDAAAHAALVVRELGTRTEAIDKALEIGNSHFTKAKYKNSLRAEDVIFGYWDKDAETFLADTGSRDAVLVNTGRAADRRNPVSTYLLKFAGLGEFDIRRQSVFETYIPTCFREGIVGQSVVDISSNNLYSNGFCVHSNTYVSMNSGNSFADGTVVSMPDRRDIVLPDSGMESNPGLSTALRDGSYQLRIVQRIDDIIDGVRDPSSPYFRDYIITGASEIALNRNDKLDETAFTPGRIHTIECYSSNQKTKIHAGSVLRDVVIWTNCEMMFGEGVVLENVTIVNENTNVGSFNSASGIQIGRDDGCAEGGGAQLVTRGGIDIPAQLKMFGGQMIAAGDISFTSEANGIEGASIIAGGRVDGTSNASMAFCGTGMEDNFEAEYFRLAR